MESNELGTVKDPVEQDTAVLETTPIQDIPVKKSHRLWLLILPVILLLVLGSVAAIILHLKNSGEKQHSNQTEQSQKVDLSAVTANDASFEISGSDKVIFNGQVQATQGLVLQPSSQPSSPETGEIYLDSTSKELRYYNGTKFITVADKDAMTDLIESIGGSAAGGGVVSLQGATGDINLVGGSGLSISASGSNINISLPQNLATTANPTFAGITLNQPLPVSSGGTGVSSFLSNSVIITNGSGGLVSLQDDVGGKCLVTDLSGNPAFGSCSGIAAVTSINGGFGDLTVAYATSNSVGIDGTITIQDATSSNKGVATFNTNNFTVSGGDVTLKTSGTGAAFVQGGNNFGATARLGTNSAHSLELETNDTARLTISSGGDIAITGNTTIGQDTLGNNRQFTNYGPALFKIQGQTSSAFMIQNSTGNNLLEVETNPTENLISNSSFSSDDSSTWLWTPVGDGTTAPTISWNEDIGNGSLQVENGAFDPSDETKAVAYAVPGGLTAGQTYVLTVYARSTDGIANQAFKIGYMLNSNLSSRVESGNTLTCDSSVLTLNDTFRQPYIASSKSVSCTITPSSNAYGIYFRTNKSNGTWLIDNVILQTGSSIKAITDGRVISGTSTSIIASSNNAFYIQQTNNENNLLNFNSNSGTLSVRTTDNALAQQGGRTFEVINTEGDSAFDVSAGAAGSLTGWFKETDTMYYRTRFAQAAKATTKEGPTYVYVVGGVCNNPNANHPANTCPLDSGGGNGDGDTMDQVQFAELTSEGTGAWALNSNVNLPRRSKSALVTAKGYLYVLGGENEADVAQGDVYYNKIFSGGKLQFSPGDTAWRQATSFTNTLYDTDGHDDSVRSSIQAVYYNNYIYVFGGRAPGSLNGTGPFDTVIKARVFADGHLSSWTTENFKLPQLGPLSQGVASYGVVVNRGYIYLVGGESAAGAGQTNVFYTQIQPDGTLGAWVDDTLNNPLPSNNKQGVLLVKNDYLYFVGGTKGIGPAPQSTVYFSRINADGTLEGWSPAPAQMQDSSGAYNKRTQLGAVIHGELLYAIGGNGGTGNTNQPFVTVGKLSGTSSFVNVNAGLEVDGAATFNNGITVTTAANSQNALTVSNQNGGQLLQIDTLYNMVTLGGHNTAEINNWGTTVELANLSGHGSVVLNGYLYSIGGDSSGSPTDKVYFAKLNTNGSVNGWTDNSTILNGQSLPEALTDSMVIAANGYIYVVGGNDGIGASSAVYFARPNLDGSITNWKEALITLSPAVSNAAVTIANGYIYIIGGADSSGLAQDTVQYARLKPDGTLLGTGGNFFVDGSNPLTEARKGNRSVFINGYIYVIGGDSTSNIATDTVYSTALNSTDGSLVGWNTVSEPLSEPRAYHTSIVANGYLYVIGGRDDSSIVSDAVFYSKIEQLGELDAWGTVILPEEQDPYNAVYNHSSVITNGFVYVIGGKDDNNANTNAVYYGSTAKTKVGGSLDLVGVGSQTLTDSGGGGLLTAGNTTIVGTLDVRDSAIFGQSVVINSTLTTHGDVLLQSDDDSPTAFQIQNADGDTIFNVNAGTGQVQINGDVVMGSSNIIHSNFLSQTDTGQNITIDAGNDDIFFVANGITFSLPTTGGSVQEICTTSIICASGAGQAVLLHPGSAQENNSTDSAIFLDATSTGALIQLQSNSVDAVVVDSSGTLILGTVNQLTGKIIFNDGESDYYVMLDTSELTSNRNFSFPDEADGEICISSGNCSGVGGSVATAGGTPGTIAVFTGTNSIGDSDITNNTMTGTVTIQGAGGLVLGLPVTTPGQLIFTTGNSDTITLKALSSPSGSTILTLPDGGGTVCTTVTGCASLPGAGGDLQSAYEGGNTIEVSSAEGDIEFDLVDNGTKFTTNLQGTSSAIEFQDGGTTFATFSKGGTTTFRVTSPTAFVIQSSTPANLFTADTTNRLIKIGTGTPTVTSTTNGGLYVTDASEFAGNILIGTTSNGALFDSSNSHRLRFTGNARNQVTVTMFPEYVGATLNGSGIGTMTADFCSSSVAPRLNINATVCNNSSDEFNYYAWTTAQGSSQQYNIYIRYRMPTDFDGFTSSSSIKMFERGTNSSNTVELSLFNSSGNACGTATTMNATSWTETSLSGDETALANCTAIVADGMVTFRITMTATQNNYAYAGPISFTYFSKF